MTGLKAFLEHRYSDQWNRSGAEVIPSYDPLTQSQIRIEESNFSYLDFLFDDDQDGLRLQFDYSSYSHYIRANAILL